MLSIRAMPAKAISEVSELPSPERVEFPSRRGSALVGDLQRAGGEIGPTLVLCHGMESTRNGTKQQAMAARFLPLGFSMLRFDFSYVGESEGRFEDLTLSGEVQDALGALDFLQDFAPSRTILVGSSMGGAVALLAAASAPDRVHAVATIAAVADAGLFTESLESREIEAWRRSGRRAWRGGHLRSTFLDDIEAIDIPAAIATIRQPLFVAHGESDPVVPLHHARIIESRAAGRVELATFPGVGHRFEEPGALDALLSRMESWLLRIGR
jgi:pimeloyl-ACP methyl ester carboxylesterase